VIAILPRYVLRETLRVFLLAATAVSGIIFISFSVRLLNRGLNVVQLRGAAPYIILMGLPFALPSGLLIATVLTFGRMSGDNELIAARAHGINPWRLVVPVLVLALLLSGVCMALNHHLLPRMSQRLKQAGQQAIGPWLERLGTWTLEMELGPYVVYVGGRDPEQPSAWRSVAVVRYADDLVAEIYVALSGSYELDEKAQRATITLHQVYLLRPTPGEGGGAESWTFFEKVRLPLDLAEAGTPSKGISDLTWAELWARRKRLKAVAAGHAPLARPRAERNLWERRLRQLREQQAARQAKRAAQEKLAHEARQAQARLEAQAEALAATNARLEETLRAAQVEAAVVQEEIHQREDWLREETDATRARELRQKIAELRQRLPALTAAQEEARREMERNQARLAALHPEIARHQAAADAATARAAALAAQADKFARDLAAAEAAYEQANAQAELIDIATVIHYRLGQSLGPLIFALIGIPLGILIHRGSAVVAFGASLGVVLVLYYPLYNLGRMLAAHAYLAPALAAWIAPGVCALLGVALLVPAMRR